MRERDIEEGGERDAHEKLLQIVNFKFSFCNLQSPPLPLCHFPLSHFSVPLCFCRIARGRYH